MTPAIFKAYDIRGLSPGELEPADARRIALAISQLHHPKRVVVGRDMRLTSPALETALVEGFVDMGVDVTRIGLCSTPLFNFAISEANGRYDLGVMVTASHNPSEYNGLKITAGDNLPIGQGSGMEEVRDLACSNAEIRTTNKKGDVTEDAGVLKRYISKVVSLTDLKNIPAAKIAVDAGNGMNGLVLPALAEHLKPLELLPLYWELDGSFPNHEANPLKVETLEALRNKVVQEGCLFGAAFDGDGDRVGFVDEAGEPIPGDLMTALLAQEVLRDNPGGLVLYDIRASRSLAESVVENGGRAEMTRVGHAFIKRAMKEKGGVFAGELSMHFYFKDFANCESGDYAMLLLLRLILREGKPLSALWRGLRRYAHSGEINFEIPNKAEVIAAVAKHYEQSALNVSTIDGIRMDFEDWWFNLRPSNTEPLLRLNLEAKTPIEMESRKKELVSLLEQSAT